MALINTSVPNLIQGVSQQPDATRFDGQCEEQVNALSSVAEGLKKRPNTRHIAKLLDTAIDANSFVHFINRSASEKYVVIHDGTYMCAYNLQTGAEASIKVGLSIYKSTWTASEITVHNADDDDGVPVNETTYVGTGYPVDSSYLDVSNPQKSMRALTIADTTILLNTSIITQLDTSVRSAPLEKRAFVFIKQPDYGKKYAIDFGQGDTLRLKIIDGTYVGSTGPGPFGKIDIGIEYGGTGYTPNTTYTISYQLISAPFSQNIQARTNSSGVVVNLRNLGSGYSNAWGTTTNVLAHRGLQADGDYNWAYPTPATSNASGATFGSVQYATGDSSTASNAQSSTIITNLYSRSIGAASSGNNAAVNTNFDTNYNGNGLTYKLKAASTAPDFKITTRDDLADSGMGALYKEADSISSLPLTCLNGFTLKIIGDADLNQDDYYVKFETADGSSWSNGSWVETIAPDSYTSFNNATLPHQLTNTAENEFTLEEINYNAKTAGDSESNPAPSFINNTISNLFFFKNRLGFLSNENVILSEAGTFYNFFRTTVTTLLDSAPIDVSVNSKQVTNLKSAIGFQENLILFSESAQFALKGGDLLTPKTVSINPITNFDYTSDIDPLPLGSYIYYPFTRGAYTGLREFTVNANTDVYDSAEVTEHVPSYIPKNIVDMAGTSSEDIIALVSGDEPSSLYIYNYFWNNQQKVLSAWSKFTFTGEIRGMEFIASTLYAVITNSGQTHLVEMPLESGLSDAAGYVTHLDMRVALTVPNGSSTITLPYTPADNTVQVYTTDGLSLNCTNSGATVTLSSPVSTDTDVWVGIPYTMKYTFSEQLFKAKAGNGKSPSNAAKLMIRNGSLYFDKSAYFKVKVTPKFRDTYTNIFTPDVVGSSTLGSLSLDSGFYRFPVFTKAQDTTITIENESALPSTFQSAEFESFVHSRSNRYG